MKQTTLRSCEGRRVRLKKESRAQSASCPAWLQMQLHWRDSKRTNSKQFSSVHWNLQNEANMGRRSSFTSKVQKKDTFMRNTNLAVVIFMARVCLRVKVPELRGSKKHLSEGFGGQVLL